MYSANDSSSTFADVDFDGFGEASAAVGSSDIVG